MKYFKINKSVLEKVFQCDHDENLNSYVRLETWGEGSCFFHSLCMLILIRNQVHGNNVTYTLDTPVKQYKHFTVNLLQNQPFKESFRQVGIALRKKLGRELEKQPTLWKQFKSQVHINPKKTDKNQTLQGVINDFEDKHAWADIWTIRYAAWRLKINTLFINPDSTMEPIYCGVENFEQPLRTVFIYWSNHSHFEPVIKILDNQQIVRSFGQNHAFIKCLSNQYKKECPLDINF